MVALRSLVEVEDLVVLAEAVAVEVAVRIVEQDALGVEVGERRVALDRLPEGGRVLEGEALLAQRVAEAHPRAFLAARGAAVAFVDQHQIVALEGIDGDGLVAHLVLELVDVEDLDRLPGEQSASVLVEQLRRDARRLELAQVLLAQPLVGREQDDAVQLAPPAVFLQVVLVLKDVGVHQQRLAAAGGAPVGELVELRPGLGRLVEGRDLVGLRLVRVVGGDLRVQRREQRLRVAEVAVEVDLGEEQRQVLEVLPDDRLFAARDAPIVQPLRVLDDVLVVFEQQLGRQLASG